MLSSEAPTKVSIDALFPTTHDVVVVPRVAQDHANRASHRDVQSGSSLPSLVVEALPSRAGGGGGLPQQQQQSQSTASMDSFFPQPMREQQLDSVSTLAFQAAPSVTTINAPPMDSHGRHGVRQNTLLPAVPQLSETATWSLHQTRGLVDSIATSHARLPTTSTSLFSTLSNGANEPTVRHHTPLTHHHPSWTPVAGHGSYGHLSSPRQCLHEPSSATQTRHFESVATALTPHGRSVHDGQSMQQQQRSLPANPASTQATSTDTAERSTMLEAEQRKGRGHLETAVTTRGRSPWDRSSPASVFTTDRLSILGSGSLDARLRVFST